MCLRLVPNFVIRDLSSVRIESSTCSSERRTLVFDLIWRISSRRFRTLGGIAVLNSLLPTNTTTE